MLWEGCYECNKCSLQGVEDKCKRVTVLHCRMWMSLLCVGTCVCVCVCRQLQPGQNGICSSSSFPPLASVLVSRLTSHVSRLTSHVSRLAAVSLPTFESSRAEPRQAKCTPPVHKPSTSSTSSTSSTGPYTGSTPHTDSYLTGPV